MSDDRPARPRPRSRRRSLLIVGSVASLLLVCGAVIALCWVSGSRAGERQAESDLRRAQKVEAAWHIAHPDPTAPVLPDYSRYWDDVARKTAKS